MNPTPLRTAVVAGACAVALSFLALPAHAAVTANGGGADCSVAQTPTDDATPAPDDAQDDTDDGGTAGTPAPEESSPAPEATTTPTVEPTSIMSPLSLRDASADDLCEDDDADADANDDDSADATPAPAATQDVLPAEKGTPRQRFADSTLEPKVIAKRGIRVEYTGLTAGKVYQPYVSTGRSGGELGKALKADKHGRITFTYRFGEDERQLTTAGAVYTVGLLGQDTDLRLTQTVAVKYDSDLTWDSAIRHGKSVTLSASVQKDGASGRNTAWKKVEVAFQKKVGSAWKTVKTVRTNGKGVAKATVRSGVGTFRAVVDANGTVFGSASGGHRK